MKRLKPEATVEQTKVQKSDVDAVNQLLHIYFGFDTHDYTGQDYLILGNNINRREQMLLFYLIRLFC